MTSPYPKRKKALVYTYQTRNFGAKIILEKTTGLKKLKITSPAFYNTEINKFKPDEEVTLSVTNKKPKRTENQSRYYWGVYLPLIAKETGDQDIESLHILFKSKFLTIKVVKVFDNLVRVTKSTTGLSVVEFTEYVMSIEQMTGIAAPPTDAFHLAPLKSSVV